MNDPYTFSFRVSTLCGMTEKTQLRAFASREWPSGVGQVGSNRRCNLLQVASVQTFRYCPIKSIRRWIKRPSLLRILFYLVFRWLHNRWPLSFVSLVVTVKHSRQSH